MELEAEVSQLKQEAAVERVKQDLTTLTTKNTAVTDVERQHKVRWTIHGVVYWLR